MCLIAFAWRVQPGYPLIVAANRDEFHARETAPAGFWTDAPHVLAGRDRQRGGTWMGVTRSGRFAALSNYRDGVAPDPARPSRGQLVADYLKGTDAPSDYAARAESEKDAFPGFNLVLGNHRELYYVSNRGTGGALEPGIHAVSNGVLNEPWPKVKTIREGLSAHLENGEPQVDELLELLADARPGSREQLPATGMDEATEQFLSPVFIPGEIYGTRASTVLILGRDHVRFVERRFGAGGARSGTQREAFSLIGERE